MNIVTRTIRACRNSILQASQSFEIYGFDVILNDNEQPFLLEVNLSPACEDRAPFLSDYLSSMAEGLLDILAGNTQLIDQRHPKWLKIVSEEDIQSNPIEIRTDCIIGTKLNHKRYAAQ